LRPIESICFFDLAWIGKEQMTRFFPVERSTRDPHRARPAIAAGFLFLASRRQFGARCNQARRTVEALKASTSGIDDLLSRRNVDCEEF